MNEKEEFMYTLRACIYDLEEYISKFNDDSLICKSQECIDYLSQFFSKSNINNIEIQYEGELYRKSDLRAGYDIVNHENIIIPPRQITKIKTDVKFPNGIGNNFALVTLRSSYQGSGLLMPAIGIFDSNYFDYLFITVFNSNYQSIKICKGDRFCQLVFLSLHDINLIQCEH